MRRRNEEQDFGDRWSRSNFRERSPRRDTDWQENDRGSLGDRSRNYINRGREMIDRGMNKAGRGMRSDYGRQEQFRFNEGRDDRWTRPGNFERYDRDNRNRYDRAPREDIGYNADYSAAGGFDSSESDARQDRSGTFEMGGYFGKGPKGWKRSPERIKEDVSEALWRNPRVDASEIDVTIENDNCVCLRGTVNSREAKREAENCVENLSGVEDVRNELRIKLEPETEEIGRESNLRDIGKAANFS